MAALVPQTMPGVLNPLRAAVVLHSRVHGYKLSKVYHIPPHVFAKILEYVSKEDRRSIYVNWEEYHAWAAGKWEVPDPLVIIPWLSQPRVTMDAWAVFRKEVCNKYGRVVSEWMVGIERVIAGMHIAEHQMWESKIGNPEYGEYQVRYPIQNAQAPGYQVWVWNAETQRVMTKICKKYNGKWSEFRQEQIGPWSWENGWWGDIGPNGSCTTTYILPEGVGDLCKWYCKRIVSGYLRV